jgi:hypothetical protein
MIMPAPSAGALGKGAPAVALPSDFVPNGSTAAAPRRARKRLRSSRGGCARGDLFVMSFVSQDAYTARFDPKTHERAAGMPHRS